MIGKYNYQSLINIFNFNEKFKYNLFIFFLILIFLIPLIMFGIDDLEEYTFGFYSSQIIFKNFFNPFIHFIDEIGAGSRFPIGHGVFFHPLNILLFNKKIYYISFISLNLITQIIFFNRILKFYFKENYNKYLSALLIIFCIPNYNYIYSDEWLSIFFSYSLIFVIFYYLIKFIETSSVKTFIKLSLIIAFWITNGHIGYQVCVILVFLSLILISLKKIKFSREIFIIFILLILLTFDKFYFLFMETNHFDATRRAPMGGYRGFDWILGLFYPINIYLADYMENFLSIRPDFWIIFAENIKLNLTSLYKNSAQLWFLSNTKFTYLPVTGIHFIGIILILPFIKLSRLNKTILFLAFFSFFLTLDSIYSKFFGNNYYYEQISNIFSAKWFFRDLVLIFVSILFIQIFQLTNNKLFKFILISLILYSFSSIYLESINKFITKENNFIVNNVKESPLKSSLNFKKNLKNLNRISISERAMGNRNMRNLYRDQGIFGLYDLNNYGLRPFQVWTKNISHKEFNKEKTLLYGHIYPNNKLLSNNFFLNLFHIEYILLTPSELPYLEGSKYNILSNIETEQRNLILIKRDLKTVLLKSQNIDKFRIHMEKCIKKNLTLLTCTLKVEKYFRIEEQKNFVFKRNKLNSYEMVSKIDTDDLWILPFKFDKYWKSDTQIKSFSNFIIGLKPIKEKKIKIFYFNNTRFTIDLISFFSLFMMLYFFYRKSKF
jgi:hypothetical protein